MKPPPFEVEAIVVGSVDYGESDRIVRLLCAELGRVHGLARRARSRSRRYGGAFDLGNHLRVSLRAGRDELWMVEGAELLEGHLHSRADLGALALLSHCCELVGGLARQGRAEPRLHGLLAMALALIEAASPCPGEAFRLAVEAKALTFAGLCPVLERCGPCGGALEALMRFDPVAGGAAHPRCRAGGVEVEGAWLQAVEEGRRRPLRELLDLGLPPGPPFLLCEAIEAQLNQALRSRSMLGLLSSPVGPG